MRRGFCLLLCVLGPALAACGGEPKQGASAPSYAAPSGGLQAREAGAPAKAAGPRVVFLGDSLTAGYGLEEAQAFPALVARELAEAGTPIEAVNAGVSGDTSAGGLARLSWLLKQRPDVLVVELGANDALRGQPPEATERNLRQIVERAKGEGVEVLLIGMLAPPNYGPEFTRDFGAIYPRLARQLEVPLVPFLLSGVAGRPELNLPDGMHPTPEGHAIVARTLAPYLREALGRLARRVPAAAP